MGGVGAGGRLVALGVTGCIGAYKAVELLRRLQERGLAVQPVLTTAAQQFVTPLTFQALARRPAITGMFDSPGRWEVEHIALSDEMDLLLVAPATANVIAKFACGLADDFLTTLYLAAECPVVVAPAMNAKMWRHAATRGNVETLIDRGVVIASPGSGYLACGWEGEGRLAEIEDILDAAAYALKREKSLWGRKFLVTAGPTQEDLDPVRFISNRSSGRMGYALAREAAARGAGVVLVSGPVSLRPPYGVEFISVRSAEEMDNAVRGAAGQADVIIMAAAVGDFRPREIAAAKIKKGDGGLTLELERCVDILAGLGQRESRPYLVGFAAESEALVENAKRKLPAKNIDLIIANPVGGERDVLGAGDAECVFIDRAGVARSVSRRSKEAMAGEILDEIERRLEK